MFRQRMNGTEVRWRVRTVGLAGGLLMALLGVGLARSGEPAPGDGRAGNVNGDEELMRHAALVHIIAHSGGGDQTVARVSEPLLRYSDPARSAATGALWAFGTHGRPTAVLEMEALTKRPVASRWVHGVVSLSPDRITASWDDGRTWKAAEPGLVLKPIPDAPAPAESKSGRLRQMKALTRRFGAHEDAGPVKGKTPLRLMPTPIHRYEDAAAGLQDGAIFVFAFGTNPEALLVLESRAEGMAPAAWYYGFARVTGASVAGALDGQDVWSLGVADPPYTGRSYMNRFHPMLDATP